MEIDTTNQVQGLNSAQKVSDVKREKEDAPGQQTAQAEESPDYRISFAVNSGQGIFSVLRQSCAGC